MFRKRERRRIEYAVREGCILACREIAAAMRKGEEAITPEMLETLALEFEQEQQEEVRDKL